MSMADYESAVSLIARNPQWARFVGPRSTTIVSEAETVLGMHFPQIYRRFLLEFGAGEVSATEFYGIPGMDLAKAPLPSGIRQTMALRQKHRFPNDLLVVGDVGDGGLYCLEIRSDGSEGRVVVVEPGQYPLARDPVGNDFGEFFLSQVQQALAIAMMSPEERRQATRVKPRGSLPD